jgi:hypothetical protein
MKTIKTFEAFVNEAKHIKLNSVGSVIDQDGIVYPQLKNGKPDLDNGVEFSEISDEWLEGLSDADRKLIAKFEEFTTSSGGVNEARYKANIPKMYIAYMGLIKKVRELEDKQKELAEPYFAAKDSGDKETMKSQLELMKKNQKSLDSFRVQLKKTEAKYIKDMDFYPGSEENL